MKKQAKFQNFKSLCQKQLHALKGGEKVVGAKEDSDLE